VPLRTHDGFSWVAPRRPVWSPGGQVTVAVDSVHPPAGEMTSGWLDSVAESAQVVEVMYPGHALGRGSELARAMDAGAYLAVDVSHVHIQRESGAIDEKVLRRLFDYDRVCEVHVSANDGRTDRHWPATCDSFGLPWAAERAAVGVPVICESYLHRVDADGRRRLMGVLRDRLYS